MKLNRRDLQKILYDFNSISNRLLQANYEDYLNVLKKFISFLNGTSIIYDYIVDCGECTQNLDEEFQEIIESYGYAIFSTGESDEEEVCNVYAILKYIVEKDIVVYIDIAQGYSSSNKPQDVIKGFNDRFVMILIRHIERYLTKVGIDMGLDEKNVYNVTVRDGQAIIANDNAVVTANNTVSVNSEELLNLIESVRNCSENLLTEEKEALQESLEVIEEEASSDTPKKSMLRTAISVLKGLKGSVEFSAAVASLIQFVYTITQIGG